MKQTIEIEVPDGKRAIWKNGKIFFIDTISELPMDWEEFCRKYPRKEYEAYINPDSEIKTLGANSRRKDKDQNVLPSEEAAKAHLALIKLHQLRDCYRQGWKPDWNNWNQEKYIVELKEPSLVKYAESAPYFLAFQSKEIAEKFKNSFIDLIRQASDLIYI